MKRIMKMIIGLMCLFFLASLIWAAQPVLAKDKKEILIGTHNPLSGIGALPGADQKWAYAQAVNDINKAGGIYVKEYGKKLPVKLITIDDESDPGKAAAATERLIKRQKVDLMLSGQVGAMGTLPGMITAEKYKTYYHGGIIWPQTFIEHNFKYCTMYFFDPKHGGIMPFEVFNSVPEGQRPKRPALFMEDSFDGKTMGDIWTDIGAKYGYQIALRESMGMGAKDFTSQVLKGKEANIDAILCMANVPETVTLVRQLKENKLNIKWFQGFKGTWSNEFWDALGSDAEGILLDGFWSMDYAFPGAKQLGEQYHKDFKKYSVSAGFYYATAHVLFQAIEKAGTLDDLKVRQAVMENEFMSVNGPVKYNEKGIALFPLGNLQWRGGKQVLLYPLDRAKVKGVPIVPWDQR
jgi:branched-chain amino acid transport system substrate-binding protein